MKTKTFSPFAFAPGVIQYHPSRRRLPGLPLSAIVLTTAAAVIGWALGGVL